MFSSTLKITLITCWRILEVRVSHSFCRCIYTYERERSVEGGGFFTLLSLFYLLSVYELPREVLMCACFLLLLQVDDVDDSDHKQRTCLLCYAHVITREERKRPYPRFEWRSFRSEVRQNKKSYLLIENHTSSSSFHGSLKVTLMSN